VTASDPETVSRAPRAARLPEFELTDQIIGAAIDVRKELGRSHGEVVYRNAIQVALEERGVRSSKEVPIRVHYHGREVGFFRGDLLVEQRVLVELKAGRPLEEEHVAQLLAYLRASGIHVGLLIHIGDTVTVRRVVL
jgi:GxxExxY protein